MSNTATGTRDTNPFLLVGIVLIGFLYAVGVTGYNIVAFGAVIGLFVFIFFVRNPEFGVYATTGLLLLQGASGVIGSYGNSSMAITSAQIVGAAAMAAWMVGALIRQDRFAWDPAITYLVAFAIWALVGTLLSVYAPDILSHWARMVFRLALLVLAVNTLDNAKKLNRYLHVLLVCAVLTSVVSIVQYVVPSLHNSGLNWVGGGAYVDPESLEGGAAVRVAGQAGHSNWLAMTLILLLPINAFWFYTTHRLWARVLIVACAVLQVSALVLTFARTGFIIGAGVMLMLVMTRMVRITPLRIFALLMVAVIGFMMLPPAYIERVFSPRMYVESESVRARWALQSSAATYAAENPIFGLGTGGFGLRFIHEGNETAQQMRYVVEFQNWQAVFIGTHNMFLQILADTGVIGFLFFAYFYYLMYRELYKARRHYDDVGDPLGHVIVTTLFISLSAFLLCAVFLHALHQPIWWMIAAAALAIPMHKIDFREYAEEHHIEPEELPLDPPPPPTPVLIS